MRILGIDPGLATLGYGVIDTFGSRIELVKAGAVITTPNMAEPERLVSIRQQIKEILETYAPDQIAFEELFFCKNITTGMSVSAARGVRCHSKGRRLVVGRRTSLRVLWHPPPTP